MAPCPDRTPGPLTITQGQAQYTTETGYQLQGPVRPKGELDMRLMSVGGGGSRALKMRTAAQIDRTGTVHGRQVAVGANCSTKGVVVARSRRCPDRSSYPGPYYHQPDW